MGVAVGVVIMYSQMATMEFAEVHIDQKYHPHIIGKKGANGKYTTCQCYKLITLNVLLPVNKIKEETCTSITIPSDKHKSDVIRIEGDPQGVAAAKKMIIDMAAKLVSGRGLM